MHYTYGIEMGKTLHFAKKSLKIFSVVVSAALPYVFLEVHRNTFLFGQYFCRAFAVSVPVVAQLACNSASMPGIEIGKTLHFSKKSLKKFSAAVFAALPEISGV